MGDVELPADWHEIARRIAREVAQRRFPGSQLARDLCDEAFGHIWERRNAFDPAKGSFEAWCYRVVNNLATDLLRQWYRRLPVDGWTGAWWDEEPWPSVEPEDRGWENERALVEKQLDGEEGFSPGDLKQLETLPVLRRVIALAVVGWWRVVPPHLWHQWLCEAAIDPPFPPPQCCPADGICTRARLIAQTLRRTEDSVRAHYYRSKPVLKGLKYGRDQL